MVTQPILAAVASLAVQAAQPEVWYKVIAGVIAIPAALLGLVLSYNILRKTTLETRKLERELRLPAETPSSAPRESHGFSFPAQPQVGSALLLLIRFVVLEVTLRLWNVVPIAVGYLTAGLAYGYLWVVRPDSLSAELTVAMSAGSQVIRLAFDLIYWLMAFGFGWPLLKDTCVVLGIRVDSLLSLPSIRNWRPPKGPAAPEDA
jgi:hypothetical protein